MILIAYQVCIVLFDVIHLLHIISVITKVIMSISTSQPATIEQLIEVCRSYVHITNHQDRVIILSEWAIAVVIGTITVTNDEINDKFLSSRIWGDDRKLTEIRIIVESLLSQKTSPVERKANPIPLARQTITISSAGIRNYRINVSYIVPTEDDKIISYPIRSRGYVTISPRIPDNHQSEVGRRLSELVIVDARRMARIIHDVLKLGGRIFDIIPSDQLINLGITTADSLHLWKGTDGRIISFADDHCEYVGRLTSDGRGIDNTVGPATSLELCHAKNNDKLTYSRLVREYTDNSINHRRLVELVRANVSELDRYQLPDIKKIKYDVRIVALNDEEELDDNDQSTYVQLAYQNWVIIDPAVDDEMADKIFDYTIDNKDLSMKSLIKGIESMLDA